MYLMFHLPRLLLLRWHCCRDKFYTSLSSLPKVEDKLYTSHGKGNVCLPFVRVRTPSVQFSVQLLQSSNDLVLDSRKKMNSIIVRIFLRNSSFLVEYAYRPMNRFEASAVKAMRPILTREFFFQFIVRLLYTPPVTILEVWYLDIFPLLLFPLSSRCRNRRT